MYFIVYKITNNINKKEYIGAHKTSDLNDGYMGSGKHLKHSQKKYGLENFSKEIIFRAVSSEAMYFIERMLVDEEYVARDDTYNLKLGGSGGFDHINTFDFAYYEKQKMLNKRSQISQRILRLDECWANRKSVRSSISLKQTHKERSWGFSGQEFKGKHHSEETKKKIGDANSKHQKGEKNSQYGKMWIYNLELKENKKIPKGDTIPDGWFKGRKMSLK